MKTGKPVGKLAARPRSESIGTHARPVPMEAVIPAAASEPAREPTANTASRGRILMVSFVMPCPPAAGNEQHLYRMLHWLKGCGYQVVFLLRPTTPPSETHLDELRKLVFHLHVMQEDHTPPGRLSRLRSALVKGGKRLTERMEASNLTPPKLALHARLTAEEDYFVPPQLLIDTAVLARQYRPFAVIAQYVFMTRCFSVLDPSIIRIVDTHDMFSTRREKVRALGIEDALSITTEEEATMLRRADVVMTSQRDEASAMQALVPGKKVFTIAIDMDLPTQVHFDREQPQRLLIVAGDNLPNAKGIEAFLACAWPQIRARHPDASLHIIGKVGRHFPDPPPGVVVSGFVRDLAEAYGEAQVVVNPVYAGSGLKIKSVEALAYGKPLVTWPMGVDGMCPEDELPFKVVSSWPHFVERVCELLTDPAQRRDLSCRAIDYIRARYTTEIIYQPLKEILERRSPQ